MLSGHVDLDDIHRMRGGMLAWRAAGLPLEVGDADEIGELAADDETPNRSEL